MINMINFIDHEMETEFNFNICFSLVQSEAFYHFSHFV